MCRSGNGTRANAPASLSFGPGEGGHEYIFSDEAATPQEVAHRCFCDCIWPYFAVMPSWSEKSALFLSRKRRMTDNNLNPNRHAPAERSAGEIAFLFALPQSKGAIRTAQTRNRHDSVWVRVGFIRPTSMCNDGCGRRSAADRWVRPWRIVT